MNAAQLALFPASEVFDAAGLALCESLDAEFRRAQGITLTPSWLVELMLQRLAASGPFQTIVDPGAGTGRFCMAAAKRFPGVRVVAVERSEAMLAVLRRTLASAGLTDRVEVVPGDFRDVRIELSGRAAFVGNPPYVRHHDIEPSWKLWYATTMARFGQRAAASVRTAVTADPGLPECAHRHAGRSDVRRGHGEVRAQRHRAVAHSAYGPGEFPVSRPLLRGASWWSLAEIEADIERARQEFRRRRLGEPLHR